MRRTFQCCLIFLILIIVTLPLSYLVNDRFIKFYEKEPVPLFASDFVEINTTRYLKDNPKAKYGDFNSGPLFNITDYGAVDAYYDKDEINADIIQTNTEAINDAINDASLNGGVALIPAGDYVSGTIQLKSNITLRMEGNLIGSRRRDDYSPKHFIIGENVRNITVEGNGGKIMGEGEYFWNNPIIKPLKSNRRVFDVKMLQLNHYLAKREKKDNRPSPFILFKESENIRIRNLLVNNSPGWTLTFELSNRVIIKDTVFHNNIRGGNVDGIDIVATSNVNIKNVLISTADDGIALKNPKTDPSVPMANITVRNTRISSTCNGFKIGTETYSDIINITFVDSEIITTEFYPGGISGVSIESVDGSEVRNIKVNNITMDGVLAPLFIRVGNRNKYEDKDLMSQIDNVTVSNLFSYDCQLPSIISGVQVWNRNRWDYSVLKATNIFLNNFTVEYLDSPERLLFPSIVLESPDAYPEVWMFGDVPAYGIYIRHADVVYENIDITPRASNTREKVVIDTSSERIFINALNIATLLVGVIGIFVTSILFRKQVKKSESFNSVNLENQT